MDESLLQSAFDSVEAEWPHLEKVDVGLVLGSGWSEVAEAFNIKKTMPYKEIVGLGATGVVGHAGLLALAEYNGLTTLIFQGRRHWYEGVGWTPIAIPYFILKKFKTDRVVLTNAAGGIREDLRPGALMLLTDHINCIGSHPLIGPHDEFWGPRFPDQTYLYDADLRAAMRKASEASGVEIKTGVYVASSGPTYETPAEIGMFRSMGADAVGMSTVPEAMLANAAGMKVLGLSCISNCAAGILDQPLTHQEVTAATAAAMPRMKSLLTAFWDQLA